LNRDRRKDWAGIEDRIEKGKKKKELHVDREVRQELVWKGKRSWAGIKERCLLYVLCIFNSSLDVFPSIIIFIMIEERLSL